MRLGFEHQAPISIFAQQFWNIRRCFYLDFKAERNLHMTLLRSACLVLLVKHAVL